MKYTDLPHVAASKAKAQKNAPLEYESHKSIYGITYYTIANCGTKTKGIKILLANGFYICANPNYYKKQSAGSFAQYAHWNGTKKTWLIEPGSAFVAQQEKI